MGRSPVATRSLLSRALAQLATRLEPESTFARASTALRIHCTPQDEETGVASSRRSQDAAQRPGSTSPTPSVLFLPGNGHDPVRLERVREEIEAAGQPFDLVEAPYPKAASFQDLLDQLESRHGTWSEAHPGGLIYATGIGGLVALSLRARGAFAKHPIVVQGAVLWGLEKRWFPRIMRLPGTPHLLAWAFQRKWIQARFQRHHLRTEPSPDWSRRFFAGYADGDSFAAWFDWLTPGLLRELEAQVKARPAALERLEAWWGELDSVVGPEELAVTERALGATIPVRSFPDWAHYPMIDDPKGWVREVSLAVEAASQLP